MFQTSALMYGVLFIGGMVCIVVGVIAGLNAAWKARGNRDGKR